MKKERYASPEFRFQELFLFEGVADVCWGHHECELTLFYDPNRNNILDSDETIIYTHDFTPDEGGHGEGCSNIDTAIQNAMGDIGAEFERLGYGRFWTEEVQNTILSRPNAGESSSVYIPVHS